MNARRRGGEQVIDKEDFLIALNLSHLGFSHTNKSIVVAGFERKWNVMNIPSSSRFAIIITIIIDSKLGPILAFFSIRPAFYADLIIFIYIYFVIFPIVLALYCKP